MNLRQLRYFVRVVELGSITRAAEALRIAQPALGLQVKQLEDMLGVQLLARHSRGVEATPAGRLLFDRARAILRQVDDTQRDVAGFGRRTREALSLGLSPSLVALLGPDVVQRARLELPERSWSCGWSRNSASPWPNRSRPGGSIWPWPTTRRNGKAWSRKRCWRSR